MKLRIRIAPELAFSLTQLWTGAAVGQPANLIGFSPPASVEEHALEARFDANLSAKSIGEHLRFMSAEPNQVGSPHDKANAEYELALFKAWGWDAHIETFSVLYPTPKTELLQLLGPSPYTANLSEPPIAGDATTYRQAGGLPAWNAYGGDGDVTGQLVYVNYGMPADYETLRRLGVSVRGKIVIARYGGGWRGLKPKLAHEHGAIGCIIYSDPADDGYATADPYPKGPSRPAEGVQRGSVSDWPLYTGDPLTPGYGSVAGAPRLRLSEAKVILHIPVLPISYGEAVHFLAPLGGPVAPPAWRGALPITYHVGGDGPSAHLVVAANWDQAPIYDVIAVLKGAVWPDQWVIRGNHRDGWVFGAQDPLAGQTALMEEAKSLGALVKTGWRPARTIVYASWDGEEPALLGSTEWAETHARELQAKAVVYINSDTNDRGFLFAAASYTLRALVDQVAMDVPDPETGTSVRDRAMAKLAVDALDPGASSGLRKSEAEARRVDELPVGNLGSGSDFTPFSQHLGIASIDLGYGGEGQSEGVYHSAYDTFEHYSRFGDPGFVYGVTLAKTAGRLVLRTADAEVIPLDFDNLATTLRDEVSSLEALLASRRDHARSVDRLLDAKAYRLAADPTRSWGPPDREPVAPDLDFSPLESAVQRLRAGAASYREALGRVANRAAADRADAILQRLEQSFLADGGLPGRPWYRNLLYAPGLLTGYDAKTLPGVREAIESGRWDEAQRYIGLTAEALDAADARIGEAAKALAP